MLVASNLPTAERSRRMAALILLVYLLTIPASTLGYLIFLYSLHQPAN